MKKSILVTGPFLSRSGYGEMARFALRALRSQEDKYDIFLHTLNWGQTGWLWEEDEERQYIDMKLKQTLIHQQNGGDYDITIQTTIPNEWKRMAPINIGYTAGIETSHVTPEWLAAGNEMDKIITISKHSADTHQNTVYDAKDNGGQVVEDLTCKTPVEYIGFPVRNKTTKKLNLALKTKFNFLCVAQAGPRKNVHSVVASFIEEFKDESDVGLVLKISTANNCTMDFYHTKNMMQGFIRNHKESKDMKCKVYILHGALKDEEMNSLYTHPKIKASVSLAHGEGFGLPLFEAASQGQPVIATGWSGHLDFLQMNGKDMFGSVKYDLAKIQPHAAWEGVLSAESGWAYPNLEHAKRLMRDVYDNHRKWKTRATKLKKDINKKYTKEKLYAKFCKMVDETTTNKNIEPIGTLTV
tara:strand:- start:92 stop:1327 length:1236 start_codon:yes stop_codon:yes gene_type:complete